MKEEHLSPKEARFSDLPRSLRDQFIDTMDILSVAYKDAELASWIDEALSIVGHNPRFWDAGIEYASASKEVSKSLPFSLFKTWAKCGTMLAHESPNLATAYFRASPIVIPILRQKHISSWANLGKAMYKGSWKSSILASKFFDVSPMLVRDIPFWDLETFSSIIEQLSQKSYDLAMECLTIGEKVLGSLGQNRAGFLSLCKALIDNHPQEIKGCLESVPISLASIDINIQRRLIDLSKRLSISRVKNTSQFLTAASKSIKLTNLREQGYILDLSESLYDISPVAVPAFLNNLEQVLSRITPDQLDSWFQKGIQLLDDNVETGLAYFRMESKTADEVINKLSSNLELDHIKGILQLYCTALSGTKIEILASEDLINKGIGWVNEAQASTEGSKLFLANTSSDYHSKEQNFAWYKVVSTHQVAHLEFGSFLFSFDKPSTLFKDSRNRKMGKLPHTTQGPSKSEHDLPEQEGFNTDMGKFFSLFPERKLALDIFTVLEDSRLDRRVTQEYPGIKKSYKLIQSDSIIKRPDMSSMPVRESMVELLVRLSLDQVSGLKVPKTYRKAASVIAKIQKRLLSDSATVEDTAEATLRVYDILSRIPNSEQPEKDWANNTFDQQSNFSEQELQDLLSDLINDYSQKASRDRPYESINNVGFRGDFKPELVQILEKMRKEQSLDTSSNTPSLTQELLEEILRQSADLDENVEFDDSAQSIEIFAQNILKEAGSLTYNTLPQEGYLLNRHIPEGGGPLESRGPQSFVYNEWDFRAGDYKPNWCAVQEKIVEEGDLQFFNDTLSNYRRLLSEVKRQFELVTPQAFRKVQRLTDGEEIDLDAAIESTIELRNGITPSEKIYWLRNKVERDVAVVFLLDMSASTAEAIDEGNLTTFDHDAPEDPVEYMIWLRSRREGMVNRHYKRIIDLEKEGTALLMQALESIADTYGIYGFSGYGRENVEFYIIKDLDEPLTESVKKRIDKISPLHATRMGPAIRHATSKLERRQSKTKILFLISDGRPQDRGYSREGVEKEYAVHDTHMALTEARMKGITPFCLTVDKSGHDYLRSMCGDMKYEVLGDIWSLPRRLPQLYRNLTI